MQYSKSSASQSSVITQLFVDVFTRSESQKEGELIGQLVSDLIETTGTDNLFGFVAQLNDAIIGSIFFSRLLLPSGQQAFILSPVAVATDHQGKGVGQQLITFGIDHLRKLHIDIVVTYGDPRFYSKVGFDSLSEEIIKAPFMLSQPEGWLAQSLSGCAIQKNDAPSQCVAALSHQKYW